MEREIRTVLEFNFNFSAFSINLGNMPQEQDRYLRILIAGSKKAITRKWLSKGIPSVSEGTEIVQEMYLGMDLLTSSLRHARKNRKGTGETGK